MQVSMRAGGGGQVREELAGKGLLQSKREGPGLKQERWYLAKQQNSASSGRNYELVETLTERQQKKWETKDSKMTRKQHLIELFL